MVERAHLSIGEVLSLVQEDFPDVTISKIRFLESQGLLDPERTPSGYRKFYDADIERLAWILTQQRDNFLPLKVIRERLDEWDATGQAPDGVRQTPAPGGLPGSDDSAHEDRVADEDPRRAAASLAASSAEEVSTPAPAPEPEPVPDVPAAEPQPEPSGSAPAATSTGPESADEAERGDLRVGPTSTSLTAEELAGQADVPVHVIEELESFGMIESRRIGPDSYFEPDARAVVDACRRFLDHGVEVRHLRMYKIAAEREAGVFEQLVMPLLKQRNPEARGRAVSTVAALAEAGEALHAALLRHALSDTLP